MTEYKLIAIDIDGTLLKNDESISEETKKAIKRCDDNGVKVCLCTGRNVKNTVKVVKQLNNGTPFVSADGAVFYDTKNNKVIKEYLIKEDTLREITTLADKYNLYMEFCSKDNYIKYVKNSDLEKYCYGGVAKSVKQKLHHHFIKHVRYTKNMDTFIRDNKNNINQFLIGGPKEELDKLKENLEHTNFSDVDIRYDLWEEYIFIVVKGCTKANGLNILSEYYNISVENMISIGDQMNDIDMIKSAGLGVAMGNAHKQIKECARFITKTNEEDGVAYVINKFIFND